MLELSEHVKPWHLVGWHDETSNTIGLAKKHQSVVVDRAGITSLSVSFMRPAKGRGWVSLEAKSKEDNETQTFATASPTRCEREPITRPRPFFSRDFDHFYLMMKKLYLAKLLINQGKRG